MVRSCSLCGTTVEVEGDAVPLGWSPNFTERGVLWQCGDCVREHVRNIEAKLPEELWE
jgi:hypothetical protein